MFKGDMNYLDFLLQVVRKTKESDDATILDPYSADYWSNAFGCASPCYELLFREVAVQEVIIKSDSDEANKFEQEMICHTYVQLTDTYKNLVNKYY